MKALFYVTLMVLSSGCTSIEKQKRSTYPVLNQDYFFSVEEKVEEMRFHLIIESKSKFPLCLSNSRWPSEIGAIDGASELVFVQIDKIKYPFKEMNMGYCPFKECAIKVEPSGIIKADIFYKDFNLPEHEYLKPKELILNPHPFWCESQ
ncbi:MAG: hypothetical protein IPK77_06505 [Cellvibrio sp.]|nr:hypothetical protein [Cellvibrio sp.]